jgi:hypothetical protein
MDRVDVLSRLRGQVSDLLVAVEAETGLEVGFESPSDSNVVASYRFTPPDKPVIYLCGNWEDVDVAHELMHMKLELIEGYSVLAWRRKNIRMSDSVEKAFGRVRAIVDDEVVHARLVECGYRVDGEVLKYQLFDNVYTRASSRLKKRRARFDDCMGDLDDIGYGELWRSSFLVQAHLILESYGQHLENNHLTRLKRFIDAFETHLIPEATKAHRILAVLEEYDVQSVGGHKQILLKWAQMENLDRFVGVSSYQRHGSGFLLPFPED